MTVGDRVTGDSCVFVSLLYTQKFTIFTKLNKTTVTTVTCHFNSENALILLLTTVT